MNEIGFIRTRILLCVLSSPVLVAGVGYGQSDRAVNSSPAKSQATLATDLSGIWEPERGRGRPVTPAAELTPEAKTATQASRTQQQQDTKDGNVVPYVSRWCMNYGMPFMMHQSPPIDIVQGENPEPSLRVIAPLWRSMISLVIHNPRRSSSHETRVIGLDQATPRLDYWRAL